MHRNSASRDKNIFTHRSQHSRESAHFNRESRQESFGNINVLNVLPMLFRKFSTDDNIGLEGVAIGKDWLKKWINFKLLLKYNVRSLKKSLNSFMIGVAAVFLVVVFVILINNMQIHLQYFNLKSVEDLVSSTDIVMSSRESSSSPFLNYTYIKEALNNVPGLAKNAPRWLLPVNVVNTKNKRSSKAIAVFIDSDYEEDYELAPLWSNRPLSNNEMHCSDTLIRSLNLLPNSGDTLAITINTTSFFRNNITNQNIRIPLNVQNLTNTTIDVINQLQLGVSFENSDNNTFLVIPNTFFSFAEVQDISFQVVDAIDNTNGKFASALGNVILLDRNAFYFIVKSILNGVSLAVTTEDIDALAKTITNGIKFEEYAAFINIVMDNRYEVYLGTSKERKGAIAKFSNDITLALGNYPVLLTPVISMALDSSQFLSFIFNEIFFSIIFILIILAIAVIYSLMNKDVHEKTYEYGMLRSLGLAQNSLIYLLLQKALLFAIPGILASILCSFLFNLPLAYLVSVNVGNDIASQLNTSSIILGSCIGLVLPLFGIIIPTRKALGTTLRDALDLYHSTVEETKITVEKLKSFGLSPLETTMSLLFVIFGFLVYYMIPLSFVFQDFTLFFRVFTLILMGLILGLTIIGQFLFPSLEIVLAYCLTKVYDSQITDIVIKNLNAHRSKNRYTSLVFTLCLSYIIFVSVMFNIQADSLNKLTTSAYGSDIRLTADKMESSLNYELLKEFLINKTSSASNSGFNHIVSDFTFTTFDLRDYFPIDSSMLSSLSGYSPIEAGIYGVQENYLSSVFSEYTSINEPIELFSSVNVLNKLYQFKGTYEPIQSGISQTTIKSNKNLLQRQLIPFISDKSSAEDLFMSLNKIAELNLFVVPEKQVNSINTRFIVQPVAFVNKWSGYPSINSFSPIATLFITLGDYLSLLNTVDTIANTNSSKLFKTAVPFKDCFIKLKVDASDLQKESFMNEMNSVLTQDIQISNLGNAIKKTLDAKTKGSWTLNAVSVGAMILCFFVLIISFESNIKDNSWEYGVLRSLGFTKALLIRVYIYESLCLVISSSALGTVIGCLTGLFFSLQSNIFLELPMDFKFPLEFFLVIVLSASLFAIIGSVLPALELNKKTIAATIKGTK